MITTEGDRTESNEPLRVAMLVPAGLGRRDGNTVRAVRISAVLAARFHLTVLSGREQDEPATDTLGTARLDRFFRLEKGVFLNPFKLLALNFQLLKRVARGRFAAVYAQGPFFLPALFVGSLLGTKFIYEAHALAYKERAQVSRVQPLFLYCIEAIVGKLASGVVALSVETGAFYSRLNRRVFFVPVFVDTDEFRPKPGVERGGVKRVGLVGPFDGMFNRGQLDYLNANLNRFDERIRFVLIGKLGSPLGSDRVSALGFVPDDRYPGELAELDALMVPVGIATFGPKNKIIEAMACGLPVFSSPGGVVGLDFARPGENIVVYPLAKMAEGVNARILDGSGLERIGREARRTVEKHYGAEACGAKIAAAIREVCRVD